MTLAALAAPSLGELLRVQSRRWPAAPLLRFGDAVMTFADVDARSEEVAAMLQTRGAGRGDRVAVMLPNGLEFPVVWLGIAKAGAVMVPVNTQYRAKDLQYVLHDAGASLLIADPGFVPAIDDIRRQLPELREVITLAPGAVAASIHSESGAGHPRPSGRPEVGPDDLLNIQYTSGTTGEPKGCMLTHEYWLLLAERAATFARMRPGEVAITAQPFYYMDPQWNVAMCIASGASLVMLPRFSASTFWRSVAECGATFTYVLGAMPVFLLRQPPDPAVERGHRLRFVACSGIVPSLHAEFEARWGVP